MNKITSILTNEFKLAEWQVENTIKLINDGNTIPFIARYRKEATGELSDEILRSFFDRLTYLRNLESKKAEILRLIDEQEKLTDDISLSIENSKTLTELEDIYRPFRPKRRTRASIAKEKGLLPLAELLLSQDNYEKPLSDIAKSFVSDEKSVLSAEEAFAGAMDILAEQFSDNPEYRKTIREFTYYNALIVSKGTSEEDSIYSLYYNFSESVAKIAHHRVLALNRGEKEGFLSVKVELVSELIINYLERNIITNPKSEATDYLRLAIADSYSRLIAPSVETEIRNMLTENAQNASIKLFSKNLSGLLLQPPIKGRTVLGVDPGYRTGCKLAIVDDTGKVLATGIGYFTLPHHNTEKAKKQIKKMINDYNVEIISIGNGTASKESEIFISDLISELNRPVYYAMTNEAGASVYSASKLATEEFPDYDVALRSAVSIARRLQDPLAELVKIDPKSIGVGQYQHDMNQKVLSAALDGVVEDCVNSVGIDLNTASPSLLSYISGINKAIAKNITAYRDENGKFKNRRELLKVPKLGAKAFEQCAGFLRIPDGNNLMDNTSVHPESYSATLMLLEKLNYTLDDVANNNISDIFTRLKQRNITETAAELGVGVPTVKDIADALLKKGRDPREELPQPTLRKDVLSIEDLTPGMLLTGTVRNVIDFGAFIDIGVHQDGLVHISQICNKYIKHPTEILSVGDIVQVKILETDIKKKRISLTMKDI